MKIFRGYVAALAEAGSWKLLVAVVLTVCRSLTEGAGVLLLLPALQLAGVQMRQDAVGRSAQFVQSVFAAIRLRPTVGVVLASCAIVISLIALLNRWQATITSGIQQHFMVCLRGRLYRGIAHSEWLFFARSRSSDFAHALTSEVDRVGLATLQFFTLVAETIVTSVYIVLALKFSALTTVLVLLSGGVVALLLTGKTRALWLRGEDLSAVSGGFYASILEHLSAMKIAKSYGAEERTVDIFSKLAARVSEIIVGGVRDYAAAKLWSDISAALILVGFLYLSLGFLGMSTAAVLLLLVVYVRLMPKLSGVQQSCQMFVNLLPAFVTIMEVQSRCDAAFEPTVKRGLKARLRVGVRLERVCFAYGSDLPRVISDLDLTIGVGQTCAIVGPSGAGKTTVADLVIGVITPTSGRVLIDETPLSSQIMQSWREQIGYVAQETFLFHDSVRANLLWARPSASEAEIRQVLRSAAAEEFVGRLSDGIETVVGDRGVLLSGGERQRLALARALLRRPSLLILDEATSSLDSENERRIQNAIDELHGEMTILIITHRLSTVRSADVIYVLERGGLVESGTWASLSALRGGRFRALCEAQDLGQS